MLNQAEYYVKSKSKDIPEIESAVDAIAHYITEGDYHQSKEDRLSQWECFGGDLHELVISIFTLCLQAEHTYQSLIGALAGKIPMKDKHDRLQTMAEVIAIVANTGLVRITKFGSGKSIIVDTEYVLDGIPESLDHQIAYKAPALISKNFTDDEGSMLLGSSFNAHKGNICLDHLNRMNQVKLQLNIPFLMLTKEEPKKLLDTMEKQLYWDEFKEQSLDKYLEIGRKTFHHIHKYDSRGRTYAVGYHVNYQGSSFKKACVQLAKGELLNER
jgi:hypothetical protein